MIPYLILGVGLAWVVLMLLARDNAVTRARHRDLDDLRALLNTSARKFEGALNNLVAAMPSAIETMKRMGDALRATRAALPDEVAVANRETLLRLAGEARSLPEQPGLVGSVLPAGLIGIRVVIDPHVPPGLVLLRKGKTVVSQIDLRGEES